MAERWQTALARAEAEEYNAFLALAPAEALAPAAQTATGPLAGIPVAVKDNIAVAGLAMTCGSRLLAGYTPPEDAAVVGRLRNAGALIVGKTNLDEFAMGSYGLRSAFGPVKNPRDGLRCPGGSSSGSGAAVAAGIVPLALGSDTGGSVRIPAAYCGVAGFKPSWGALSRQGMVAHAASLDTVGILGESARLCLALFDAAAGPEPGDSTTFAPEVAARPLAGLRIGLWRQQLAAGEAPVQQAVLDAARALERLGARLVELDCGAMALAGETYAVLAAQEAVSCLARFDGLRYGAAGSDPQRLRSQTMGAEVKSRLTLGAALLSMEEYAAVSRGAARRRQEITRQLAEAFTCCDLLLGPTAPGPAPRIDETGDAARERRADGLTVVANLAGLPALALPWGASEGLPLSVQLMAPRGWDRTVLAAGAALEEARQ